MSTPWKEALKLLSSDDVSALKKLALDTPLQSSITLGTQGAAFPLSLTLYQFGRPIPLSEVIPMLEHMGLHAETEQTDQIDLDGANTAWISRFNVAYSGKTLNNPTESTHLFCDALTAIQKGLCEDDGLNCLILGAGRSWQDVTILRAYTCYLLQVRFRYTRQYIEKTLSAHPNIANDLIILFLQRFDTTPIKNASPHDPESRIDTYLENVTSLDEDIIIRRFRHLIRATVRTNYFKTDRQSLALKFKSDDIPELPLPHPLFEIFIYSPRFEAIHLRKDRIARGGLRWSDRPEDFRTEVLGLMKAQRVKNAVIVPSGAKGGFVLKASLFNPDRDTLRKEVVSCYQAFIRGLLDLTDNIKNGKSIPPIHVVCYDDSDPYLVVAADKGTATFSDIANAVSAEYDFWLGDAFASGGKSGYNHKNMGITARGAWESIKRHFRELGVDLKSTPITVAGIGDMSGDVFGNGLIYSDNVRLVAAFDHRDIFLDPNPNPKKSFAERERLFNLTTSSWQEYDRSLISKGGGVYARTVKSIPLSPEVQACLGINESSLMPSELVRAILKAPVDLLYNGGIGTYVKGSTENNADVGDRANDLARINGSELRCKVVCEGGNLGFTQQGRIEYSLQGGLINADFIDNSAGVDCSDHEVNLKILLNHEVAAKRLTLKKRDQILASMADDVAALVLKDNYEQALTMSFSSHHAIQYLGLYQSYIHDLENKIDLNRVVEYLPDDKKLLERRTAGMGLTRPELAVLLAYTKIYIKNAILASDMTEDPWFLYALLHGFPEKIRTIYTPNLKKHRLRHEIIATTLANQLVNTMGITFVYRMESETGMPANAVVRAWSIASTVYQTSVQQKQIDELCSDIPVKIQYQLLHHVRQLLNLASRWFLRNGRLNTNTASLVKHYSHCILKLKKTIPALMSGATKEYIDGVILQLTQSGLPLDMASNIALSRGMYTALNVTEVATQNRFDLMKTASVYFEVGAHFGLVWFRDQIASDNRDGNLNSRARLTLRDALDTLQRNLCISVITQGSKSSIAEELILQWRKRHASICARWDKMLETVHGDAQSATNYTLFFVAMQEFWSLVTEAIAG